MQGVRLQLQVVRRRLGVTQRELSERARMAQSDVSAVENGRKVPGPGWRQRLAEALDQPESALFRPADQDAGAGDR